METEVVSVSVDLPRPLRREAGILAAEAGLSLRAYVRQLVALAAESRFRKSGPGEPPTAEPFEEKVL